MNLLRLLALAALLSACGRPREAPEKAAPSRAPQAQSESDEEPGLSPVSLPLPDDFTRAAGRRVRADNYDDELARIERELAYEARKAETAAR